MGQTYYLYTCCTDGSGTGEQCGTFSGESHPTDAGAIAGTVIGVVVGLTLLIVFSCYQGRCGCFRYRRDQLIAATVAARPQQPQVVYVQPAPAKDITSV